MPDFAAGLQGLREKGTQGAMKRADVRMIPGLDGAHDIDRGDIGPAEGAVMLDVLEAGA